MVAAPFYLTLMTVVGAWAPEFSHLASPMSVLGGMPGLGGLMFNVGVVVTGLLVIVFAVGPLNRMPQGWTTRAGTASLVVGGLGLAGAGVFHCDEGCRNILIEPDGIGRLHIVASLLAGMGTGLAPLFLWATMRRALIWKDLATPTLWAAILANLFGIAYWTSLSTGFRLHSVEGLIQRLGLVILLVWIFGVSVRLRRIASGQLHNAIGGR